MLKKVVLSNNSTRRSMTMIVDTDDDEKAIIGAGKVPNENARVSNILGADEAIQRATSKRPDVEERLAFFGGLAKCLERDISTIKSLQLQAGRLKSPRFRGVVAEVAHQITEGEKLSDAMGKYPDVFPADTLALIRAGEESGQLPEVCHQIAKGQRKTAKILKKLRAGMIYPAIVLCLAVAVVIIMSFTLVPAISKLYGAMNVELPWATTLMMGMSDILLKQPWLAALPVIGLVLFFRNWGKIFALYPVQQLILALPTVGNIVRKSAATVGFRTLSLLIKANVRISSALEITADSVKLRDYQNFFRNVREHVNDGLSLPESFLMESHMLGKEGRSISAAVELAGETGSMNEVLDEIAEDYEEELDNIANQIDKILEPITLVVMGVFVGFLVYAIYGPIFNLSNVILPKKKGGGGSVAVQIE